MPDSAKIAAALRPLGDTGRIGLFLLRMLGSLRPTRSTLVNTLQQTYLVGARSLVIIMICGFFVGMVLALQAINALEQFGASDQVSLLVGKSLFRELGPVLTALLFAGRAGTSIAAEIGLMKATGQLDAMELMAIDPVERIALPRFLAGLLSVPLLTAMFNGWPFWAPWYFHWASWAWTAAFSGANCKRVSISTRISWAASGKAWSSAD